MGQALSTLAAGVLMHPRFIDLTGQVFGRVTVISYVGRSANRNSLWQCRCACGHAWTVNAQCLRSGDTKSCGCLQREKARAAGDRTRTHSMSRTSTYVVWRGMLARCGNRQNKNFPGYGGRGIKVCDRWHSFENFLADMGPRPEKMTIERQNNDGNYEPGNCKWATVKEQNRNKRTTRMLTLNGKTQCLADWAKELRRPEPTLWSRLARGWPIERALS